jgi:hypothetical protein
MHPHNVLLYLIITSVVSGAVCALVGSRKQVGALLGGAIGFTFGILAFTFIFFLPRKRSINVSNKLKRYKSMLDKGLITRSEYTNLREMLFDDKL